MTSTVIDDVTRLFDQMQAAPPNVPGTLRRRLRVGAPRAEAHLEVSFPENSRILAVRLTDSVDRERLRDTAGLRCTFEERTLRVATGPTVDPEVFSTLVADLVQHLSSSPQRPGAALVQRLESWQRMLAAGLRTGISSQAQMGLYGELLVLRDLVLPVWGAQTAASWVGPTGADQDFRLAGAAVEVKCGSHQDAQRCRISNEAQLDTEGIEYLALVHQSVRTATDAGTSLPELVDAIRAEPLIADDPASFEDRLLHAGWLDLHRGQYERERYALTARRCFHVSVGFPSLTRRQLPVGVSAVAYSLDLNDCRRFLVPETAFLHRLASAIRGAEHDYQR